MTEQATNSMPPAGKPFWKKKRWWVVTLFLLWIVWVYTIPRFPFEPYTLYSDMTDAQRENPIPFNQLVSVDYLNSDESPYKPGRAPLPKPPQEAIERYPGVRSCLVASEQQKHFLDLAGNFSGSRQTFTPCRTI